jgi:hypothetical protein
MAAKDHPLTKKRQQMKFREFSESSKTNEILYE